MATVIGEEDLKVVLVAQIEAAMSGPRSVKDVQPPLLIDLHADGMQRLSTAQPLIGWRAKSGGEYDCGGRCSHLD